MIDTHKIDIAALAKSRYTTKAFDPAKAISAADIAQLKTLLQYSPSSVNSQPWHFFLAGSPQGKQTLAKATEKFSFNTEKILNASHVVVLCRRTDIDNNYLTELIEQEAADGRIPDDTVKNTIMGARQYFVGLHQNQLHDMESWMDKQVYLALGTLLLGAAARHIDACPIEGFDADILDEELALAEKGLHASVMVALGYRAEGDFNASLPKSRLPEAKIITEM
ncbi:oxygen-insensitive NAD(P)H-dependent nitroreductase NfsB [Shewanella sp. NFH-SH190041]|uniref:oxygen-insensitive NAD(P)H nitroreductase n=1 Tax=Shewanella sp. NFH-SH190041 TaxID=2950245 RepID=UPI0021C4561E|nr:oxygen-insensitive NAD(P)H nitroreductase [Shewanella sp. NFH-SH190041]BDM65507.1 oxygen-insensitive NAD(P)H-dependent nitroreductase NfsB [Shewanella sp. NFH-SH190041]